MIDALLTRAWDKTSDIRTRTMAKESSIALGNVKVMNQDGTGEGWLDILGGTVDLGSAQIRGGKVRI
ncbi:hypothetical protein [uncultured Mitsuokella sp.]|uniref:hypothetical protein n=1 Tax=uncultured Mitsuokella sp. TaxID=453120 RepID=UPI0026231427|nr:hypothetical protein [uncultured Mitsuokella sp.]